MNQTVASPAVVADRIACLAMAITHLKLLVPITAVAEVINIHSKPAAGSGGASLYGWIQWRDQTIPLLSIETALGGKKPALKSENRIAILNAIGDASGLGYYAILLQGLPHPAQILEKTLRDDKNSRKKLIVLQAKLGEEDVVVPDLLAVETLVAGFKK